MSENKSNEQKARELWKEANEILGYAVSFIEANTNVSDAKSYGRRAADLICKSYYTFGGLNMESIKELPTSSVAMVEGTLIGFEGTKISKFAEFMSSLRLLEDESASLTREQIRSCLDDVVKMLRMVDMMFHDLPPR